MSYNKILDVLYKFKYDILIHSIILITSILILVIGVETNVFNWTDSSNIKTNLINLVDIIK